MLLLLSRLSFFMQILVFLLSTIGLVFTYPDHGTRGLQFGLSHHDHHGKTDTAEDAAHASSNIGKRSPAPQFGILDLRLNETALGNFGFQFRIPELGFLG